MKSDTDTAPDGAHASEGDAFSSEQWVRALEDVHQDCDSECGYRLLLNALAAAREEVSEAWLTAHAEAEIANDYRRERDWATSRTIGGLCEAHADETICGPCEAVQRVEVAEAERDQARGRTRAWENEARLTTERKVALERDRDQAREEARVLRVESEQRLRRCIEIGRERDTATARAAGLVEAVTLWFDWIDDGIRDRLTRQAFTAIGAMRRAALPYWEEQWAKERAALASSAGVREEPDG